MANYSLQDDATDVSFLNYKLQILSSHIFYIYIYIIDWNEVVGTLSSSSQVLQGRAIHFSLATCDNVICHMSQWDMYSHMVRYVIMSYVICDIVIRDSKYFLLSLETS